MAGERTRNNPLVMQNTAAEPRFGVPQTMQVGPPDAKEAYDVGDRTTFDFMHWNKAGAALRCLATGILPGACPKLHSGRSIAFQSLQDLRLDGP
jgi:hypothetical protein